MKQITNIKVYCINLTTTTCVFITYEHFNHTGRATMDYLGLNIFCTLKQMSSTIHNILINNLLIFYGYTDVITLYEYIIVYHNNHPEG